MYFSFNEQNNRDNDKYEVFEVAIQENFNKKVVGDIPVFTTNANGLWEAYLNNLPEYGRQHYNCRGCKRFIENFGGLVIINQRGKIESLFWGDNSDNIPEFFKKSVDEMRKIVSSSLVDGIFISNSLTLGNPTTDEWTHLSARIPSRLKTNSRLYTAGQLMAQKLENFKMLKRAVYNYDMETVDKALNLLSSQSLYRGDRFLPLIQWFKSLKTDLSKVSGQVARDNVLWVYVAYAREGFCNINSSVVGSLMENIQEGLSTSNVIDKFNQMVSPSNYMRSQSAPTENALLEAERIVRDLGIASSLKRRYAEFDEIPEFVWKPRETKKESKIQEGGVFSGIPTKRRNSIQQEDGSDIPVTVMTWDKFVRMVLPNAEKIEAKVDNVDRLMALVTASDNEAENILRWGNTFSWYYHGGIDAEMKKRVEEFGGVYDNNKIRCTLIWEGYTDLDLHCVTPTGRHIYYSDKRKDGGYLDIDMNGLDKRSDKPVENIRFKEVEVSGRYRFYVHNFSQKGYNSVTPFRVELEVNGKKYSYNHSGIKHKEQIDVFDFLYSSYNKVTMLKEQEQSVEDNWGLNNGYVEVKGITTSPNLWGKNIYEPSGTHIFFLLEGCKDSSEGKGRGFFNEMLTSELRPIRKTLEAYTENTPIENVENASACGVGYSKENEWNLTLRVKTNVGNRLIKIDRFD